MMGGAEMFASPPRFRFCRSVSRADLARPRRGQHGTVGHSGRGPRLLSSWQCE